MAPPQDPIHAIVDYVWNVLRQENGWTKINNKLPFSPSRETPEFDGQSKPYFVYKGSRETGRGDLSPVRLASLQFLIYAQDTTTESGSSIVTKAIETIDNALNRLDQSALDVNINAYATQNPRRAQFNGTRVNWTRVLNTESPDPGSAEGGKPVGYISIRYEFTVQEQAHTILY